MPEHDGLVDLGLSEPGLLVAGREDLDGDVLAAPTSAPHFAESERMFIGENNKNSGISY